MMNSIDQEFIDGIKANDVDAVTRLLQSGANVNVHDGHALKLCVENKNLNLILKLLEHNVDISLHFHRALRWSAKTGNLEAVIALLEHGADINAGASIIPTALEYGAQNGHLDIVIALLEAGANVHIDDDCTLRESCRYEQYNIVEKLLEYGANIHCRDNAILKHLRKKFNEPLADIILPYCVPDDYEYFPTDYICANVIATKNANN